MISARADSSPARARATSRSSSGGRSTTIDTYNPRGGTVPRCGSANVRQHRLWGGLTDVRGAAGGERPSLPVRAGFQCRVQAARVAGPMATPTAVDLRAAFDAAPAFTVGLEEEVFACGGD